MSKNLVVNSWVEEVAKLAAKECVKLYAGMAKSKGQGVVDTLLGKFLQYYVSELTIRALSAHKDKNMTDKEAYVYTKDYFTKTKHAIQTEVAAGVERACEEFSGIKMEYYCSLVQVGEPINKLEC